MPVRHLHWTDPAFDSAAPAGLRAHVEAANAFVAPERLRRYQLDLLLFGKLEWPDPATGLPVPCSGTLYFGVKAFAWRFDTAAGAMWLVCGGPAHGFELCGLLLPGHALFLRFDQYPQNYQYGEELHGIALAGPARAPGPVPAYLVAGHENFAHFIWNELPGLIEAEAHGVPAVRCLATWEPIAPMERLLPGPMTASVQRIEASKLFPSPGTVHPIILFAAGATQVSAATQARLSDVCGRATATPDRFVLWLSLRLTHRHPLNQVDAFAALLDALAGLDVPVEVILDGYSLAADLNRPGRVNVALNLDRAAAARTAAAALQRRLPPATRDRLTITDATGLTLPDAIALAARADFYLCHHGTQQHKIGWVYPTPGIIHAPPNVLRSQPAGWTQHQSEGAALPDYLPEPLVADVPPAPGVHPNSVDYVFADIPGMVAYVMERVTAATLRHPAARVA